VQYISAQMAYIMHCHYSAHILVIIMVFSSANFVRISKISTKRIINQTMQV